MTKFLTIREIKKLARVNKIPVTIVNEKESSEQTYCNIKDKYISYNFKQVNDIKDELRRRNFSENTKIAQLQVFLHELAHYKHSLKFKNWVEAGNYYSKNFKYCEKLADRFSQIYYKRYLNFLEKTA